MLRARYDAPTMAAMRDPLPVPARGAAPDGGTLVVIPALNEAASIGSVVAAARAALPAAVVLVIDDGSTDETASAAAAAGAEILRLPFNCGIGAAVQAGLRFAIEHRAGLIARLDADGQHNPADLGTLAATI